MDPADLARNNDRRRNRFKASIHVNLSTWQIARLLAPVMSNEGGEGLRGLFDPNDGPNGTIIWWIAYKASHHMGRNMLAWNFEKQHLEVEVNMDADGTLYLEFEYQAPQEIVDRFLSHPSIGSLSDGCLTSRGKILYIQNHRVTFTKPAAAPTWEEDRAQMKLQWSKLEAQALLWSRMQNKKFVGDRDIPTIDNVRSLRNFMRGFFWHGPGFVPYAPATVSADGSITLLWRKTGASARLSIQKGIVTIDIADSTHTSFGPYDWRKYKRSDYAGRKLWRFYSLMSDFVGAEN